MRCGRYYLRGDQAQISVSVIPLRLSCDETAVTPRMRHYNLEDILGYA